MLFKLMVLDQQYLHNDWIILEELKNIYRRNQSAKKVILTCDFDWVSCQSAELSRFLTDKGMSRITYFMLSDILVIISRSHDKFLSK